MNAPVAEVSAGSREMARNLEGSEFHGVSYLRLPLAEKVRRAHADLLRRLRPEGTQAAVAAALGLSEPTITRAKEDLERSVAVIVALGLKLVDQNKTCVAAADYARLIESEARLKLLLLKNAPESLFEDPE